MIIFVGDRPSKDNIDPNVAFVGTKSYKTLLEWIYKMDLDISEICMYNRNDDELEFWFNLRNRRERAVSFIALGKEASKYLASDRVDNFFELPHPSGLNRKLNDKKWLEEQLNKCKDFINAEKLRVSRRSEKVSNDYRTYRKI